jgi:hypothetical protein
MWMSEPVSASLVPTSRKSRHLSKWLICCMFLQFILIVTHLSVQHYDTELLHWFVIIMDVFYSILFIIMARAVISNYDAYHINFSLLCFGLSALRFVPEFMDMIDIFYPFRIGHYDENFYSSEPISDLKYYTIKFNYIASPVIWLFCSIISYLLYRELQTVKKELIPIPIQQQAQQQAFYQTETLQHQIVPEQQQQTIIVQ